MVTESISRNRYRRRGANPATETRSGVWTWGNWRRGPDAIPSKPVDEEAALGLTALYRALTIIGNTIAGLPIHVFEEYDETGASGQIEIRHRPYREDDVRYITGRPNREMRRRAFLSRTVIDVVLGNGFWFIDKDRNDQPLAKWWVSRKRFKVGRADSGLKVYEIDGHIPMIDYREGGEIVHIPNWGDALLGYDPIKLAGQALHLGISAQEYAVRAFDQGQIPPGLVSTEQQLSRQQANVIASNWERLHSGMRNRNRIAVLGSGAKFQQLNVDLDKMQMDAARTFSVEEVGRLTGVPNHLLNSTSKVTSWGTGIAEQNLGLWIYTLMHYVGLIEEAIDEDLLVREATRRYSKFNPDAILRGATATRYAAYRNADWMTQNEKRGLEELPPLEGGDRLMQPFSNIPANRADDTTLFREEEEPAPPPPPRDEEDE